MSAIRSIDERSAGSEPTAEPLASRRVKVRVRRKRSAPNDTAPVDVTREDTTILPTIRVVSPDETGPLTAPERPLTLVAVDGAPVEAVEAVEARADTLTSETPTGTADATEAPDTVEVADADQVYVAALLAPEIDPEPAVEPTASGGAEPVTLLAPDVAVGATTDGATEATADSAEVAETEPSAPARRHPTLAVMAALSQRAEPAAPTPQYAEPADTESLTAPLRLRAVRPTEPLDVTDRLDVAALDDERADAPDLTPETTPDLAPEAAAPASEAAPVAESLTIQASAADTPASVADTPEAQAASGDAQAASGRHQMWWPLAAKRRAAPETRPIGAVSDALRDDELEVTAPRPASLRTAVTAARPARESASKAAATPVAPAVGVSFARRASSARQRAAARRSQRAVALTWASFGHAAISSVAALIAVIAALRGAAGPLAWAVFGWALTLALIAGVGAAIGYVCVQLGRLRLATSALVLSQLGAFVWALGLLGPRTALLALVPTSAALALRGAGRVSAVATAAAWMALFIMDEALTLAGALTPSLPLDGVAAALVDIAIPLVGLWLAVNILVSLYSSRMRVVAHERAVEHVALQTEAQLERLRTQTEDDAEALRRALSQALRGEQPERVYAHGALSVVADTVNELADRLIDLRYDRAERKRLESATRRLTRVIERAWLGLSWSWPDATGTILDDLLALLRTPPPADTPDLLDETAPTGQVVAPHLFRGWRAPESAPLTPREGAPSQPSLPGSPSAPSQPSQPSLPSLWPSDPGVRLTDSLELPPSPRWRGPDALYDTSEKPGATER